MSDLPPTSIQDEIICIRRELALRAKAYPRWVAAGRMKQATADREIALMRAVLDRLTAIQAGQ